jgi:hypothetical protein
VTFTTPMTRVRCPQANAPEPMRHVKGGALITDSVPAGRKGRGATFRARRAYRSRRAA